MAVWVKICGVTNAEDAQAAWDAGADAIGLNFVSGPRKITQEQAGPILETVPSEQIAVALVELGRGDLDPDLEKLFDDYGVADLQLYGDVSPQRVAILVAEGWTPIVVCRAPRGGLAASVAPWIDPENAMKAAMVLVDGYAPDRDGGTGTTADWNEVATVHRSPSWPDAMRLILAGGLSPSNVAQAIEIVRPWGVDVASGVEIEPGRKDPRAIAAFIKSARAAR